MFRLLSASVGFVRLVCLSLCLLHQISPVVVLSFFVLHCPLLSHGLIPMVVFLQPEFQFHDYLFPVVSLYATNPNPARDKFFDLVSSVDPSITTVLCGDFSTVFDGALDR